MIIDVKFEKGKELDILLRLLVEAFTFDIVKVEHVSGELKEFSVDLVFEMSNGDVIEYLYDEDPSNRKHYTEEMSVNSKMIDLGKYLPTNGLREEYRKYLQQLIKK